MSSSDERVQPAQSLIDAIKAVIYNGGDAGELLGVTHYPKAVQLAHEGSQHIKFRPLCDLLTILSFAPYTGTMSGFPQVHYRSQIEKLMPEFTDVTDFERDNRTHRETFVKHLADLKQDRKYNAYHPFFGTGTLTFMHQQSPVRHFLINLAVLSLESTQANNQSTVITPSVFFKEFMRSLDSYLQTLVQHRVSFKDELVKGRLLQPLLIHWFLCFTHSPWCSHSTKITIPVGRHPTEVHASIHAFSTPHKAIILARLQQEKKEAREVEERQRQAEQEEAAHQPQALVASAIAVLQSYFYADSDADRDKIIHNTGSKVDDISQTVTELEGIQGNSDEKIKQAVPGLLHNIRSRISSNLGRQRYHVVCGLIIAAGYLLVIPGIVFSVMAGKRLGFFKTIGDARPKPRSEMAALNAISILSQISSDACSCRSAAQSVQSMEMTPREPATTIATAV